MLAQFDDGGLGVVEGAVAVVMAGVNSMTREARPADIAHEVGRLAARIGSRAGRVILLSILPATVWGRNEWPRIRATNGLLASVPGVRWVDVAAAFLDGERVAGRMVTDGVHLTMRGYVTLARQIAPVLVEEGALEPVRPPAALGGWLAAAGIRDALRRTLRQR
jgi:lysophospholipase L1-like esterase